MRDLWIRRARCIKVIDGDTFDLEVDLGYRIRKTIRVRALGLDAPEVRGPERPDGLTAKMEAARILETAAYSDFVRDKTWPLTVRTEIDNTDKYGRWLADVELSDGRSFAAAMREAGHAK